MANVNEVVTADGEVLMSVIDDTVTENALLEGYTATASNGSKIAGKVVVTPVDTELSDSSENAIQNKAVAAALKNINADTVDGIHIEETMMENSSEKWVAMFDNGTIRGIPQSSLLNINADTVDGKHVEESVIDNNNQWVAVFDNGTIRCVTQYSLNVKNADTVDGLHADDLIKYVTGSVGIAYSESIHELQVLNFTPSAVICHHSQSYNSNGTIVWAIPITNGFKIEVTDKTVDNIDYIAFR